MAKLDHEKHRHAGKLSLSARAEAARRDRAEAYLSCAVSPEPAKRPGSGHGGFRGYTEDFDTFWRMYPRKESKGGAFHAWKRLSAADRQAAYNALKVQLGQLVARMNDPRGNYCPHGSTWLRERRFDDEIAAVVPQPSARRVERPAARPMQSDRFPFGKHNGQTIAHAEACEPTYLDWLMLQAWFPEQFPDLARNVQIAISTREEGVTPAPDWGRSAIVAAAIRSALAGSEQESEQGARVGNVVQLRPADGQLDGGKVPKIRKQSNQSVAPVSKAEKDALREGIAARKAGKPPTNPYAMPDGSPISMLRAAHAAWLRGWEAGV